MMPRILESNSGSNSLPLAFYFPLRRLRAVDNSITRPVVWTVFAVHVPLVPPGYTMTNTVPANSTRHSKRVERIEFSRPSIVIFLEEILAERQLLLSQLGL
jgi:hypothetical protein